MKTCTEHGLMMSAFNFCVTQKIFAFLFGGYKNTIYLCNRQNNARRLANKGEKKFQAPNLLNFDGLIFMPILADYCNENMADAFQ